MTKTGQVWLDYDPRKRLNEQWVLDLDVGMRLVKNDPSFWQTRFQPTTEFSPKKWIETTAAVWLIYTNHFEMSDLLETRPTAGLKLSWDIWRGVRLSNYFRAEYRIQTALETGDSVAAGRLRDRVQALIPINHGSLTGDNTWYAITDAERFRQKDPQVNDGFNSQRRYRAGIAWRKNSVWAYEFLFVFSKTRSSIEEAFSTANYIFNFNLIQTFN